MDNQKQSLWERMRGKSFTVSERALRNSVSQTSSGLNYTNLQLFESYGASYSQIFQTQPAVRTVVDFLGSNIGQLSIHAYKRTGDNERERVSDFGAEKMLNNPNPQDSYYDMMSGIVSDLAIYGNAFLVKMRGDDGLLGLKRINPKFVSVRGTNPLSPSYYEISYSGTNQQAIQVSLEEMIHFRGYNPDDQRYGFPPMETLRQELAQMYASQRYMENYWRNAAQREGVLEQSPDAPEMSDEAYKRFVEGIQAHYSGTANAGFPLALEGGWTWKDSSFSPKDSQWALGVELSMKTVARLFNIPLAMVGLMDSSNWGVDAYHAMLYTETLAPWLQKISQRLEKDLVPEFPNSADVYLEFNLDAKLKGSFMEQAKIAVSLTGGPVVTVNEQRARMDLPPVEGGDDLVTPLNVVRGGGDQPSPNDPTDVPMPMDELPAKALPELETKAVKPISDDSRDDYIRTHEVALRKFFEHQRDSYGGSGKWDEKRWNRELAEKLYELGLTTVTLSGKKAAALFDGKFTPEKTYDYLAETSRIRSEYINATTKAQLDADGADSKSVFSSLIDQRVPIMAATIATSLTMFASHEAAHQSKMGTKTWIVTSAKSRHPNMNGEIALIDQPFSNGGMFPGDPNLGVDENAHCQCLLSFGEQ